MQKVFFIASLLAETNGLAKKNCFIFLNQNSKTKHLLKSKRQINVP